MEFETRTLATDQPRKAQMLIAVETHVDEKWDCTLIKARFRRRGPWWRAEEATPELNPSLVGSKLGTTPMTDESVSEWEGVRVIGSVGDWECGIKKFIDRSTKDERKPITFLCVCLRDHFLSVLTSGQGRRTSLT